VDAGLVSGSDENLLSFIRASFPSVWALELLLILKGERRAWTSAQLVATLRASELVVSRALDALVAAGLASVEADGAHYLPVDRGVEDCVERIEHLYRIRPNAVRRAIIYARTGSASAFADAFKLRRQGDD
jgi:hypothetical protein